MLIILDLDETLIHAVEGSVNGNPEDFRVGPYRVYVRPGLQDFLAFCREHFQVAVWTSSTESYAAEIVAQIFGPAYPLAFVWARGRCSRVYNSELQSYESVKDLVKVRRRGFDLTRVLVVDDTPAMLARSYGNLVRIRPYLGETSDRELALLQTYLLELKDAANVRVIEKRGWRERFAPSLER